MDRIKLFFTAFFVLVASSVSAQSYMDTTVGKGGDLLPILKPFIGTLAELRANTNRTYIIAEVSDYGGRSFKKSFDVTSADDGWRIIVDAAGNRWYATDYDGTNVKVDWFIPSTADGDDDEKTTYLQDCFNKAKGKTIVYTYGRVYRHNQINLPTDANKTIVRFNSAKIRPALIPRGGGNLYNYTSVWNSNSTGLYTGGANNTIAPIVKRSDCYEFYDASVDLEFMNTGFIGWSLIGSFNAIVDVIVVKNCHVKNGNLRGLSFFGIQNASDTSSIFNNIVIHNNDFTNFGPFNNISIDTSANVGDTTIAVRTVDLKPITEKVAVGRYFLIGTAQKTNDSTLPDCAGTYATTNKILRLKGYKVNDKDSTRAWLYFTSGSYSSTNGFVDSVKGLTAPVIKNAMVIPAAVGEHSHLFFLPPMTGTSGTNKLTISSHTTQNDARMKNFYPGVQFVFNTVAPTAPSGKYTVTQVYADSIKFTPALNQSFSNAIPVILGQAGDAMTFEGEIRNAIITNNTVNGAGHAIAMSGYQKRGLYSEELLTKYTIESNNFKVTWMGIEIRNVSNAATNMRADASNIAIDSAAHSFIMSNPSNYKVVTKDFGFGPIKVMTQTSIADADITGTNSYAVGDKISWTKVHLTYEIVDFDAVTKAVMFARFDNSLKDTVPGGFEISLADVGTIRRPYSSVNGGSGFVRQVDIRRNKFGEITRVFGGYSVSGAAYTYNIEYNEFDVTERPMLELEGDEAILFGNKFNSYVFTGDIPHYSITSGCSGRGSGYTTLYSAKVTMKSNEYNLLMPNVTGYYNLAGGLGLGPNSSSLNLQRELVISGNTFNGVRSRLLSGANVVVGGTQLSSFYYDKVDITGNNIDLHGTYENTGLFGYLYSPNTNIVGNTITKKSGNTPSGVTVFYNGTYLPQSLNIDTPLKVNVEGNTYPLVPTFGLGYTEDRYWWNDKNNRVRNVTGTGFLQKDANGIITVGTPSGGGGGSAAPSQQGTFY